MRLPEQNFWQTIKSHKPRDFWAQRVENGFAPGMPDVLLVSKHGRQSWMELKVAKEPVRKMTPWLKKGDVRIPQVNWHLKAATMCVSSYIVMRTDNDDIFVLDGKFAGDVHTYSFMDWQDRRIYGWQDFWDVFR